jgi:hypothetical protein
MKSELNQIELIAKAMIIENPNSARISQQGEKIQRLCEKIRQETKEPQETAYCYGIEVNHPGSRNWYNWSWLYPSREIAEVAIVSIRIDNKALADAGSKWRIYELKR